LLRLLLPLVSQYHQISQTRGVLEHQEPPLNGSTSKPIGSNDGRCVQMAGT